MARLHPSLEGPEIPASLRRSAPRAAIIGSAPAMPPSILSATDAFLSGPVMHPPLRPAPPSSPSSPPAPSHPPPDWQMWRLAPAGRVALAGVEIGFRGLREIDDVDALQGKMEVMLLLPSCGSPSSPSSHTPPPPPPARRPRSPSLSSHPPPLCSAIRPIAPSSSQSLRLLQVGLVRSKLCV